MKLSINTGNTIKNFGHVFTDRFKVISELVQNSRRAGATLVDISYDQDNDIVCVRDNGSGIADFDSLFVLSQSGWDEHISDAEQPFGMGFFSVFFVCDRVEIKSLGKRIDIDCKKAVELEDFGDVTLDADATVGTVVTLYGFTNEAPSALGLLPLSIKSKVEKIAETSSIDISFNGEILARPFGFDVMKAAYPVVESPFGSVIIPYPFSHHCKVIVQDLVVFKSRLNLLQGGYETDVLVYGNSGAIKVRMPDRDSIVDVDSFRSDFERWLYSHYNKTLRSMREQMNDDAKFVQRNYDYLLKYAPELLCDIDYLPTAALSVVSFPDLSDSSHASFLGNKVISKSDDVLIVDEDYELHSGHHPIVALFLHFSNGLYPSKGIPKSHWIWSKAATFNVDDFSLTLSEPKPFVFDGLNYVGPGRGLACSDISITHKSSGRSVCTTNLDGYQFDGFGQSLDYLDEDNSIKPGLAHDECGNEIDLSKMTMVVSNNGNDYGTILTQLNSYTDEYDTFMEDDLIEDAESLFRQIKVACGGDVNSVLSELIGDIPTELSKLLDGKSGVVRFDGYKVIFDIQQG